MTASEAVCLMILSNSFRFFLSFFLLVDLNACSNRLLRELKSAVRNERSAMIFNVCSLRTTW